MGMFQNMDLEPRIAPVLVSLMIFLVVPQAEKGSEPHTEPCAQKRTHPHRLFDSMGGVLPMQTISYLRAN